jgi:LytS/YehU family sensor histidine kinase
MFDECLRAIDAELRAATERARELVLRRSTIARESLEKYEKFLDRRRS